MRKIATHLLALAALTATPRDTAAAALACEIATAAFPGAVGHAAETTTPPQGGRAVIVTSLDDNADNPQPGTLRHAIEVETGPRYVVFRVGGIISVSGRPIDLTGGDIYIAGQTAPGSGITLRKAAGAPHISALLRIRDASNVIVRYLRFRYGKEPGDADATGSDGDNFTIANSTNVILDHVSSSWGRDENVDMWVSHPDDHVDAVTVQNSLLGENFTEHNLNIIIGAKYDKAHPENVTHMVNNLTRITLAANFITGANERCPNMSAVDSLVVRNTIRNCRRVFWHTAGQSQIDYIDNRLIDGPHPRIATERQCHHVHMTRLRVSRDPDTFVDITGEPSLHYSGNTIRNKDGATSSGDGYELHCDHYGWAPMSDTIAESDYMRSEPLATPSFMPPAANVSTAGADARLDCLGNWVPNSDAVDIRLLDDLRLDRAGTISISNHDEVGGYPPQDIGAPCTDVDADGMPDAWEISNGGDLDPAGDTDGDTHSNLAEYLNGSDPTVFDADYRLSLTTSQ